MKDYGHVKYVTISMYIIYIVILKWVSCRGLIKNRFTETKQHKKLSDFWNGPCIHKMDFVTLHGFFFLSRVKYICVIFLCIRFKMKHKKGVKTEAVTSTGRIYYDGWRGGSQAQFCCCDCFTTNTTHCISVTFIRPSILLWGRRVFC